MHAYTICIRARRERYFVTSGVRFLAAVFPCNFPDSPPSTFAMEGSRAHDRRKRPRKRTMPVGSLGARPKIIAGVVSFYRATKFLRAASRCKIIHTPVHTVLSSNFLRRDRNVAFATTFVSPTKGYCARNTEEFPSASFVIGYQSENRRTPMHLLCDT